jgi:hypothetical protein
VQREQALHEQVAELAHRLIAPPAEWAFYPAGAIELTADQAAKLIRMGLRRSWPDLLIIHQQLYGMELKRVGGKLSKARTVRTPRGSPLILEGQVEMFARLEAAGMQPIVVCYSVDEVVAQWERWGIPLRGRIAA